MQPFVALMMLVVVHMMLMLLWPSFLLNGRAMHVQCCGEGQRLHLDRKRRILLDDSAVHLGIVH